MISIDLSLCTGCGTCVDACPKGAISMVDRRASIDAELCDDCGRCVQVCPDQALALISAPETVIAPVAVARAVDQPSSDLITVETIRPGYWQSAVRPAVGAFLGWAGAELFPRLVPLAIDALEAVMDRQLAQRTKDVRVRPNARSPGDIGQRRRRRHRFGHTGVRRG